MSQAHPYRLGIDIGSTTVKIAVLDEQDEILFDDYARHRANIQEALSDLLSRAAHKLGQITVSPVITGSGGLALASALDIPFVQEVIAVAHALKDYESATDVAIELGGEDAKIIYFENGTVEQRMNGICAGGTGSFIDQMASLLKTDADGINEYARDYKAIYDIAARCGVFAKTDIQPLINEGAAKEDLAASIFQAVVNQTISGLACGKPIRGHVAFLGGPLHFMPELRKAFVRTLKLDDEHTIVPAYSHLFAAIGSAKEADPDISVPLHEIRKRLEKKVRLDIEVARLEPLFASREEYDEFISRHASHHVTTADLDSYRGDAYLGIDAGSTTTKAALISEDGSLLYSFYSNNEGDPLGVTITAIKDIYSKLPEGVNIVRSCSTGYGEALIKAALMLDFGEVETIAHYYAASFFDPEVDCILDIGGQDMKCIRIKNQSVDSVQLNEACSSGCGSFIETFAKSLDVSVQDFAHEALFANNPIDLGTRCTVFMNSKVKQAQKEGATVADISAGLAYSVIKNALFKVIKVTSAEALGEHIVLQGGTFYNEAVLRSFEKIAGCEAIRPDIAGIMGAFGAALVAMERHKAEPAETTMLPIEQIESLEYHTTMARCGGCNNNCRLTINHFSGDRRFITGNRCERGLGRNKSKSHLPNLFEEKLHRYFDYESIPVTDAPHGRIGIPRVLNLYENYPFWHTFFTKLGFRVVLSPVSSRKIYELGIESIPSESECYPAKLAHGHVKWLIDQGITTIFYPCIPYERVEFESANNHYNCPIVTSYPENIKNNMEEIANGKVKFLHPFISFENKRTVLRGILRFVSSKFAIDEPQVVMAADAAWEELENARAFIRRRGEEVVRELEENDQHGIVLAGRPYHLDPEVHHGIPELINSYNMAVLTEDSVAHLADVETPLLVVDQWMYHSRLYRAAQYVKTTDHLDLIQLNSFGCGLDAVTTDQVSDILTGSDKIYTTLKIDEVNNLGAARIRVRSLLSAIRVRKQKAEAEGTTRTIRSSAFKKIPFTKDMRGYTILAPQMSPIHFSMLSVVFELEGYHLEVLHNDGHEAVNTGLRYVNNDACYPSIMVVGQIMSALLSGKYDLDKTALMITQTGGGCRATNYIGFIRRALRRAHMGHIPVISLNLSGLEDNPGFKITPSLAIRGMYALIFGDVFMRVLYRMRPYEKIKGSANLLHDQWEARCIKFLQKPHPTKREFNRICREIIEDFDNLPITDEKKPRVGVVGEILVKFMPAANNYLVEQLEAEGAEAVVPDLADFLLYCFYNTNFKSKYLGMKKRSAMLGNAGISFLEWVRNVPKQAFKKSKHFTAPERISELAKMAQPIVSLGNQTGEGWFLTGEMLELIHEGVPNIVCTQPFGCLPNHVVGKGVIKELRKRYPESNIVAIDYDPGASEVNQLNRLKLMLSTAKTNLEAQD